MPLVLVLHAEDERVADAVTAQAWRSEHFDFWQFDRRCDDHDLRGRPLHVCGDEAIANQIAIRTQRLAKRRNGASAVSWFGRLLALHRALHDVARPLVLADLDHAHDTWQWTLRLDPDAPVLVQVAALLHGIDRLAIETDVRLEPTAPDDRVIEAERGRRGARLARALLAGAKVPAIIADEACALIAGHERSPAGRAVGDADALSFLSLSSPGYLASHGPAQAEEKVTQTFARMSPGARRWLAEVRLPSFVRNLCGS
jgi:hypothetical protein